MRGGRRTVLLVVGGLLVAGCGSSPDPKKEASNATESYYAALAAGNAAAVCDALSASGKQQLVADLRDLGGAANCVDAVRKARGVLAAYLKPAAFAQLRAAHVSTASVQGDSATATVPFAQGVGQQQVLLVKEKTGWKVNGTESAASGSGTHVLLGLPGDQRPRVEGKWRVVFTGGPDDPRRRTVPSRSDCDVGACGFRTKSSRGDWVKFRFDKTVGDYAAHESYDVECLDETNTVVHKRGYRYNGRWNLHVARAVLAEGQKIATELRAVRDTSSRPTKAGLAVGCTTDARYPISEDVRFVRIAAPTGEDVPVSNGQEGG